MLGRQRSARGLFLAISAALLAGCPRGQPSVHGSAPSSAPSAARAHAAAANGQAPARPGPAAAPPGGQERLKLPFNQAAAHCYAKLATNPALIKGFARARSAASAPDVPFGARLAQAMKIHMETVAQDESYGGTSPYMCCVYDLLRGMFVTEARSIGRSSTDTTAKGKAGAALKRELMSLPFEAPQWKQGLRGMILKEIETVLGKPE
ncbi:MAG: hypothetical protein HY906_20795 [Deltaproteobacteria bacterium]|nr:hypothetical protein [Deltaproteobacteria bacterium]